jgi:predicted secreted protein
MENQEKWGIGILVGSLVTWIFYKKAHAASAPSELRLTEKDSGSMVTAKPGSNIVVVLPANPSTGFGWYAATDMFPLGQPEVRNIATGPILPGASSIETRTYRITPAMIGSHRVQLEYKRPGDAQPAKIFLFDTVVPA